MIIKTKDIKKGPENQALIYFQPMRERKLFNL